MDESLLQDFLVEAEEGLNQLDNDLIELENSGTNPNIIKNIFRSIHSMKGTAGFLALHKLESVAHAGENLLGVLRDGKITATPAIVTLLLKTIDATRTIMTNIKNTKSEGPEDYSSLIDNLNLATKGESKSETPADAEGPKATNTNTSHTKSSESNVRVHVDLLDRLMNLVGELVLVRNQICQGQAFRGNETGNSLQRLNLITSELQENVMKTRMQPLDQIFSKLPRVVRDLSLQCNKKINLEIEGKETELDRTIIEAMKDPLTHLIRNAVDHGIELPEIRKEKKKNEFGTLKIMAFHEGGLVNIEIIDDGAGIDPEKIKKKALEKGLITGEDAQKMSDREIVNLVFLPGFSTAEKVSNVSGRGVGMDVVKSNIEKIGGTVDIDSKIGRGSIFKLKIPLTLAIIPAIIVKAGPNRYTIPMSSLVELIRVNPEYDKIESVHGSAVFRLRDHLLPLLFLENELSKNPKDHIDADGGGFEANNIVVLKADDQTFGLVVNEIHDTQEVVVKPLSKQLKSVSVFSGATILGDGKVSPIIDVLNLGKRAKILSEKTDKEQSKIATTDKQENQKLLVITQSPGNGRLAIPFESVQRLEQFASDKIEKVGSKNLVQYRNAIMPILSIEELLPERRVVPRDLGDDYVPVTGEKMDVVVFEDKGHHLGLVVERIIDILETDLSTLTPPSRKGISGCFILQNKVAEILDVDHFIQNADFDRGPV